METNEVSLRHPLPFSMEIICAFAIPKLKARNNNTINLLINKLFISTYFKLLIKHIKY